MDVLMASEVHLQISYVPRDRIFYPNFIVQVPGNFRAFFARWFAIRPYQIF
jgi:hypothetical protein